MFYKMGSCVPPLLIYPVPTPPQVDKDMLALGRRRTTPSEVGHAAWRGKSVVDLDKGWIRVGGEISHRTFEI